VPRELDRLQKIELNKDAPQIVMRTPATGIIGPPFKAARGPRTFENQPELHPRNAVRVVLKTAAASTTC
jgi:hypothetical protein